MTDTPPTPPYPADSVSLREVTAETVRQVCALSDTLRPPQNRMVASNAISIAQAHFEPKAWFRAIYAAETPVGFVMLYKDDEAGEYFLWRLMIASQYQRLGYGRRALEQLIDFVRGLPRAATLGVSCVEIEGGPLDFYRSLGFERTGRMLGDEIELRLVLNQERAVS